MFWIERLNSGYNLDWRPIRRLLVARPFLIIGQWTHAISILFNSFTLNFGQSNCILKFYSIMNRNRDKNFNGASGKKMSIFPRPGFGTAPIPHRLKTYRLPYPQKGPWRGFALTFQCFRPRKSSLCYRPGRIQKEQNLRIKPIKREGKTIFPFL